MKFNLDETSHLSEFLTSGQSFDIGTEKDHPRCSPESSVICGVYKQCDQPTRLRNRYATCSAVSWNRTDTKHNNTTPHLHLQTPHLPRAPVKQRHNRTFVLGHTTSCCFVYFLFTLLLLIGSDRPILAQGRKLSSPGLAPANARTFGGTCAARAGCA